MILKLVLYIVIVYYNNNNINNISFTAVLQSVGRSTVLPKRDVTRHVGVNMLFCRASILSLYCRVPKKHFSGYFLWLKQTRSPRRLFTIRLFKQYYFLNGIIIYLLLFPTFGGREYPLWSVDTAIAAAVFSTRPFASSDDIVPDR